MQSCTQYNENMFNLKQVACFKIIHHYSFCVFASFFDFFPLKYFILFFFRHRYPRERIIYSSHPSLNFLEKHSNSANVCFSLIFPADVPGRCGRISTCDANLHASERARSLRKSHWSATRRRDAVPSGIGTRRSATGVQVGARAASGRRRPASLKHTGDLGRQRPGRT